MTCRKKPAIIIKKTELRGYFEWLDMVFELLKHIYERLEHSFEWLIRKIKWLPYDTMMF